MTSETTFAVVLPAAGSGRRFGGGDKLLMEVAAGGAEQDGNSVLRRSVGLFAGRADVGQIVLVTSPDRFAEYKEHLGRWMGIKEIVFAAGGRERWESVLFGLRAVRAEIPFVAVHDAARPLTSAAVINAAFAGAVEAGGSVPCVAEPATLKRVGPGGFVSATVARAGLYQAQTPQCFERAGLLEAYERLVAEGTIGDVTDDAQVFERVGRKVKITPGEARNIKITTAEDVGLARGILGLSQERVD